MNPTLILLFLGAVLLTSVLIERSTSVIKSPAVLAYLLAGAVLGPAVLKIITIEQVKSFDFVNVICLSLIGFNVGSELIIPEIKKMGKSIIIIVIVETMVTWILVGIGMGLILKSLPLGLIYASLAAATAPAGTVDVIRQYKAKGKLTSTIFAVIGIDDILTLIIFSICLPFARIMLLHGQLTLIDSLMHALFEISLAVSIGIASCFIMLKISKYIHDKSLFLIFALGFLLTLCGIAESLKISPILLTMSAGVFLANKNSIITRKFTSTFSEWSPPVYLLFFALIGCRMNIKIIFTLLPVISVYILTRTLGKFSGSNLGCRLAKADPLITKNLGITLLSQAGVAIGLALGAVQLLEEAKLNAYANQVINIMTSTTFLIMLIGPALVKIGLKKAGEIESKI
jgi:Kef-type K+ transport system membrane component KefB